MYPIRRPFSLTIDDPLHSIEEDRFITIGLSDRGRILVVAHTERGDNIRISVPDSQRHGNIENMEKEPIGNSDPDMLEEYDFSKGIAGRYAKRYAAASNLVALDPDVLEVFPDSASVNRALRALAGIIRHHSAKNPS